MAGYAYDVFLSYLRERPCGPWVNDHLLPYLSHQLGNALNRKASVFVDRSEIRSGQKWPARLKQALAQSACLVGVWSPLYFQSDWCLSECEVMRHRESQLGYGTAERPDGLIVGIRVNDGLHFPDFAKNTQHADFERFFFDGPAFLQSPLHIDFQKAIVPLANDIAKIVAAAPPWSSEWSTAAWLDDVIARVQVPRKPKAAQPTIS
jgi:hypothetical protein